MNKNLIVSMLLAVSLAACSSKPIKEAPPAVVDKSPPAATQAKPAEPKSDTATTAPMAESTMSVNPLKDPNNILSQRSIYFDFDKDEVKPEYRALIEAHGKYLQAHADARVILQGNTDERGTREYNLSLGQRRAVSVKKLLNLQGVQDKQIETVSYGKEKAKTTCGNDDACSKTDRRVDIVYQGE